MARVPRGRVTTYGEVARLAGRPRGAREVGYALAALHGESHPLPWQRVLGKRAAGQAGVSLRDAVGAAVQQRLLEAEGVVFDARGRVSLERFGWRPRAPPAARGPAGARRSRSRSRTAGWSGRS